MQVITIKQGSSFRYSGIINENSAPKDITGYTLTSQIRDDNGNLIDTMAISIDDAVHGRFSAVPTTGTLTYPADTLLFDFKLLNGTEIVYSDTVYLTVLVGITK